MKQKRAASDKYTVPAVCKAMELLRLLADGQGETTIKGLAFSLGVPRTTCYRILRSLIAKDWVRPVEEGRHELSLGILPLLRPLRQAERLAVAVQPTLAALAQRSGLTAKASVRQGDYAVTVARCESPQATSVAVRQGAAFHLALGSSGAVLLSELPREDVQHLLDRAPEECWDAQQAEDVFRRIRELRAQGWCADLGSYRPGLHAISAPLHDAEGNIAAAITIIGFPHELPPERMASPIKLLTDAVKKAEKDLRKLALDH